MYVTRPLSLYRNSSPAATEAEPEAEGPNTGVLVMEDEAAERRWLFGLLKAKSVKVPPFPQNKLLELRYSTGVGENQRTDYLYAMLIPVLDQPLHSNQYYIIKARGNTKGYVPASPFFFILFCTKFNFFYVLVAFFSTFKIKQF